MGNRFDKLTKIIVESADAAQTGPMTTRMPTKKKDMVKTDGTRSALKNTAIRVILTVFFGAQEV